MLSRSAGAEAAPCLGGGERMEKAKLRVIIADDEPITRIDIKEILEFAGYEVVGEAADGFDAVEA